MRILIDEEYGYRYWEWIPQAETPASLRDLWDSLDETEWKNILHDITTLPGLWRLLELKENATKVEEDWFYDEVINPNNYDGGGHIHDSTDSYIWLMTEIGSVYIWPKAKDDLVPTE